MCGFAGIIHWDAEPVAAEDLSRMGALLRHRGPDEQVAVLPERSVGLSHCRLKVIDLSEGGRQPMANEGRTTWVCFNGEIYNFRELRSELEGTGDRFRSRSDTEVILRAYERWGREAFRRLDGMFAIAVWDSRRREITLARDRTGKKPLYYWSDGRCLSFASEVKAFAAHAHVPRQVDEGSLPHLLALGYPPPGKTCYRQIRQVPPAAFLVLDSGTREPTPQKYWDLPDSGEEAPLPPARAVKELHRLLEGAVRRRLLSDVPIGAFLSGGLDSTLVVGLMSRLLRGESVRTFSIGFEGDPRYNETSYAQLAARYFRTKHTVFHVSPQPFELLERLVWHYDQPFGDSSALPTYLLCQLARSHVTVALNGDGGDELFAGYDRFRAALLAEKLPLGFRRMGRSMLNRSPIPFHARSMPGRMQKFFRLAPEPLTRRFLQATGYFLSPERLLLRGPAGAAGSVWNRYAPAHAPMEGRMLGHLLRLNFIEYLPNDLHVKMDRCSMAHGLEARSPFLDTALVEWAFRLQARLKLRGAASKWILRQTFRNQIPAPILRRRKAGFGVPLDAWFRGRWRNPMQDLLCSSKARIFRHLEFAAVQKMIREHLSSLQDHGQRVWLLLTFEIWLRQLDQASAIPPRNTRPGPTPYSCPKA